MQVRVGREGGRLLNIYPNPGNGTFTVRLPDTYDVNSIQVFNAIGTIVLELNPSGNSNNIFELDLGHLADGLYYVWVRSKEQILQEKLLLTR